MNESAIRLRLIKEMVLEESHASGMRFAPEKAQHFPTFLTALKNG